VSFQSAGGTSFQLQHNQDVVMANSDLISCNFFGFPFIISGEQLVVGYLLCFYLDIYLDPYFVLFFLLYKFISIVRMEGVNKILANGGIEPLNFHSKDKYLCHTFKVFPHILSYKFLSF